MNTTIGNRIERYIERVEATPVTFALIGLFWFFYLLQVTVRLYYGPDLAKMLFYVQYNHLSYVWTWVTATLGHVGLIHLILNTLAAFWLGRWAEWTVGKRRYLAVFFIGGAITAVIGTIVGGSVSGHILADFGFTTETGFFPQGVYFATGSSMGWFPILGMMFAKRPHGRTSIAGFQPRRWIVFVILFVLSVVGTLVDVWVFRAPIGHPYHLVGLVVGGLYGLSLSYQTGQAESNALRQDH
jgi:membrane associated rhomboid family serine protease